MRGLSRAVLITLTVLAGTAGMAFAQQSVPDGNSSLALAQMPPVKPATTIPRMGRLVQEIIKDVLDGPGIRNIERGECVYPQVVAVVLAAKAKRGQSG